MYQYTWFEHSKFKKTSQIKENVRLSKEFINFKDIKYISLFQWEEHCVECSAPLCYGNCKLFVDRGDGHCRKLYYGIKKGCSSNSYNATLMFKKWGKLETSCNNNNLVKINFARFKNFSNYFLTKLIKFVSFLYFPNKKKIIKFFEYKKERKFSNWNKGVSSDNTKFLFSCYCHNKEGSNLFLDFVSDNNLINRAALCLKHGFNQIIFDVNLKLFKNRTLIRLYETKESKDTELTIFFSDIVVLKQSGKMKMIPKANKEADKVKCVIWDLDNTIFDGILIESDPNKIKIRDNIIEQIELLDKKGVIQCVCSKNNEADTIPVLKRLGILQYFVILKINWEPKVLNIADIVNELNINVNSLAFVDDSSFERNSIKQYYPVIKTFDEKDATHLNDLDCFSLPVTEESKLRRIHYIQDIYRKNIIKKEAIDPIKFLKNSDLEASLYSNMNQDQIERAYELLNRTNQLNLSGKKYDYEQFLEFYSKETKNIFSVDLKDKYGEYGQCLYLHCYKQESTLFIDELAISCRVANKFLESSLFKFLLNLYNCTHIELNGKNNKKNSLLIETLIKIGFKRITKDSDDSLKLVCELSNLNFTDFVKIKYIN